MLMESSAHLKYHRILLKLSGEALLGKEQFGVDINAVKTVCQSLKELLDLGVEVALVIGGGNLLRGAALSKTGLNRITCDQMGMLATVMNGLVLRECFMELDIPVKLVSSIAIDGVVDIYDRYEAMTALRQEKVVIFSGGTGCPLFSTDSAASLRAIEISADVILKATKVDGVYSADPHKDKNAKRFTQLSYQEVLDQQLGVMDLTAICLCQDHNMPVRVFNMNEPGILKRIVQGSDEGTLVV